MAPSPLDAERRRSGLSARELTYALHKSKAHVEKLERFEKLLTQDPAFDHAEMYYLPRDEQYRRAIRMTARLESIACEQGFDYDDTELLRNVRVGFTGCAASTTLHTQMFIKNLGLLFSDEQKQRWMQLATEWRIVGCYAQTELGHGSNVRGLETTATFIRETDEFEIHTPSLRAYKWWPGALARTANVGVVYARLLIDGKDHGVHNFFVPLRDLDTHELKPGITTGDIGGKIGFQNVDNGWCRFDRVRIPRANMGNRFSTVDRDGTYRKITGVRQEILYFTMLQTRMEFVGLTGMALAKGCTIAVRYSAVREQGYDANEAAPTTELKVLDYQTQQYRLLPQLAAAYAITLSGHQVDLFRHDLARQIGEGDLSMLDVGHAMSCGLKVFVSDAASNGIEVCRRACGGHGYLLASGLPVLLGDVVQTVTAEGENFVLTLQAGRSLLKTLATYRARGTLPRAMAFLANVDKTPLASESLSCKTRWLDPAVYVAAFEQRFLYLLRDLERRVKTSSSIAAGVQNHSVACYKLSMAYGKLVIVQNFVAAVASREAFTRETLSNPKALEIVRLLCHLFALTQLETDAGEFMESGALRGEQLPLIRTNIEELLPQIRPHAVVLVDAFNFSDHSLNSALGRFDGNVYEALYVTAQHDPVNRASDKIALEELLVPIRQAVQKSRL